MIMQTMDKYKPVHMFLEVIKEKYKIPILIYVKHKSRRYHAIKKKFPEASERMIIKHLKELVAAGILNQDVVGSKPPLVSKYALTEYGRTLCDIMEAMWNWGEIHLEKVNYHRM